MPTISEYEGLATEGPVRECLVKSVERVRDLGEVFTPAETVQDMLDQLPASVWEPHPSATFLEPAAGDGNFLVAILARKLEAVSCARIAGELPAGAGVDACEFHGLQAVSSIYAVDISPENILGGVPGHEIGARQRLLDVFTRWFEYETSTRLTDRSVLVASANWVLEHNVMVGNMLAVGADGTPTGRSELPLVEYRWDPHADAVSVVSTSLGQVESATRRRGHGTPTLFDEIMPEPKVVWSGRPRDLRDASIPAPSPYDGPARNGKRRR